MPTLTSYPHGHANRVLEVHGDVGFFLRRWADMYPDFMDRSIRHVAWRTQMQMKMEMLAERPGGVKFPSLSRVQRYRLLGEKRGGRRVFGPIPAHGLAYNMNWGDWPPGGRIAQSIRYSWRKGTMRAEIGWLSAKSQKLGVLFQAGQKTRVTPKMRRLFAAAGLVLSKGKSEIEQPPRPVVAPFYQHRKNWMTQLLVERMRHHINGEAAATVKRVAESRVKIVA